MATLSEIKTKNALKDLKGHDTVKRLREKALEVCSSFKVSWIELGEVLYAIEEDKLYHAWGHEKFDDYASEELGLDPKIAAKLAKNYQYALDEKPDYLQKGFCEVRTTDEIPSIEEINFLRLAGRKKELLPEDQQYLKDQVFIKGKIGGELKKDLVSLMKERKVEDPLLERDKRSESLIKGLMTSLTKFHAEMASLKLVPNDIIEDAEDLLNRLKEASSRKVK